MVSNASCTTNCLAPLAKARVAHNLSARPRLIVAFPCCLRNLTRLLNLPCTARQVVDDAFGIEEALMTTIHAATASQKVVDSPAGGKHDWRAGRSALANIIPASTGAATAVARVLPQLAGKLDGCAFRVPLADVSVVDLTVRTARPAALPALLDACRAAERGAMRGVLRVADGPFVSSDFVGEKASCVVDARACMALGERFFKLVAWYDNEYAYALRCVELAAHMVAPRAGGWK